MSDGIVKFDRYELHEVYCKKNIGFEGETNVSFTIQTQDHIDDNKIKRAILTLDITGAFDAKVVIAGIFALTDGFLKLDRDESSNDFNVIATSILLPYARSILSFVSSLDGSKPLIIPTVNLNALFYPEDKID